MLELKVSVVNPLGLHARAAAKLVRLAGGFESKITLQRTDTGVDADAKSILSVLHIGASCGVELKVVVDGVDDTEAIAAVEKIFRSGFGEI